MPRRIAIMFLGLAAALALAVLARLTAQRGAFAWPPEFVEWRTQSVVAGIAVGVCLAVGGVMMQALLRNPLASPDITGLSAGAGLAVMISIYASSAAGLGIGENGSLMGGWSAHAGPALLGSLGALVLVYSLSQRRGLVDPTALVLIGVVISVMCGAGIMFLQHLMPGVAMGPAGTRILIGALSGDTTWTELAAAGAAAVLGLGIGLWTGPAMDAASLGDDEGSSVGVRVGALRLGLLGCAGILTAAAVVIAGPLGFVGLVSPHVVRLMAGPGVGGGHIAPRGGMSWSGHRALVLGAAMAGAALVIGGDALVTVIALQTGRMPLGVVMALVGGAVFITLLRSERYRGPI
jgi:iron complex transport system permease protein